MEKEKLRIIVEGGIMVALALVLGFISKAIGLSLPQGGDISLASLPILVFALRYSFKSGIIVGLAYTILNFIFDPYHVFHPLSIVSDYILIGIFLGLIGVRGKLYLKYILVYIGILLSHVISGAIVFGSYTPEGMNLWIYSLIYNSSYVIPEFIIIGVILFLLGKFTSVLKKGIIMI